MQPNTFKPTFAPLFILPLLIASCGEAGEPDAAFQSERISLTSLELSSSDDPHLLHPVRVAVEAELSGDPFSTDLLIGMRTPDGQTGCVLGAMPVERGLDDQDEGSGASTTYRYEDQFVVDIDCYELAGRDDVELFASFDPWNRLGERPELELGPGPAALDLFSIVSAAAVSAEGCVTCETLHTVHEGPGLDAQLREVNLGSAMAVLPVAGESGVEPVVAARPDFSVTTLSRVTGLANGKGLEPGRVQLSHHIRPLGSSAAGLPLIQRKHDEASERADLSVPSSGELVAVSALYIEGDAREALSQGTWASIDEFELVTCLESDFEQAIYAGEIQPRDNDCAALPIVIVREEVGPDGLPIPQPDAGAAKARNAEVWGDSWGATADYNFGYSGLEFEAWLDVNASDTDTSTYGGVNVIGAGSWYEAGVSATGTVFDNQISVLDIYASFIGYNAGGGAAAMGASLFIFEFIPEFELQLTDGQPVTLQDIFDLASLDIDPSLVMTYPLIGVTFNDGCGSVGAGVWVDGTLGIDTEQTSVTVSSTDEGVEVVGVVTPYMDVTASAGVEVEYGDFVSGGITASLTLLNISVPFTVGVEVIDYSPLDAMRLVFNQYASAYLTTLSGSIDFSIEACLFGLICETHEHTIAEWNGFNTSVDLFDLTQTITTGSDTPPSIWCGGGTEQLKSGDFDGDGQMDYLCHRGSDGYKWIDYGDDGFNGTDWSRDASWCTDADTGVLVVGDFDGDGRDDMICRGTSRMSIDYADGNGAFTGTDWFHNAWWCDVDNATLVSADYNLDGRDDLNCEHGEGNAKVVEYADQNGEFGFALLGDYYGLTLPNSFCGLYDGQTIALETHHGRYVRAGNSLDAWHLDQSPSIGSYERFTVDCDGSRVSLQSHHGRWVLALGDAANFTVLQKTVKSDGSWFLPVLQDNGEWALMTHHNRFLQAKGGGAGWSILQQNRVGTRERFEVVIP